MIFELLDDSVVEIFCVDILTREWIPSITMNASWGHALDCSSKTNFQLYWHRLAMETFDLTEAEILHHSLIFSFPVKPESKNF